MHTGTATQINVQILKLFNHNVWYSYLHMGIPNETQIEQMNLKIQEKFTNDSDFHF